MCFSLFFFFQAEDGIRDTSVTGVQTCALPIYIEPTRGIDIGSRAQIYETIVRSAAQGKAVLLVSSYLPELFGLCHRLAVMSRGRLSPARPVEDWTPEAVLATAIGGAPNESA